ncbi:response regulator transcription factor [soil metagenome]
MNAQAHVHVRKVVLVDDHRLIRETLAAALELDKSLAVVATAGDGSEGLRLIAQHKPDVAVLDIDMPGRTCFDIAESVKAISANTKIILLSGHHSDSYIQLALRAGVAGYLTKDTKPEEVLEAVKVVASGGRYFTEAIRERIAMQDERGTLFGVAVTPLESLSLREREVLTQLARGLSVKEVATVLSLSRKTVDNHTQRLMAKLDIHTRSELVMFAFREKLVS